MTLYTRNNTLTTAQLFARGWTSDLIRILHPAYIMKGGQKSFYRKDIVKAEKTATWQQARREAREQAKKQNYDLQEVVDTANCFPVLLEYAEDILAWGERHHHQLAIQRGEIPFNAESITDEMRACWAVNTLRHSVVGYEQLLRNKEKHPLGQMLFGAVKLRILLIIRKRYSALASECDRQIGLVLGAFPELHEQLLTHKIKETV